MLHVPSDHIWRPDIVLYNKWVKHPFHSHPLPLSLLIVNLLSIAFSVSIKVLSPVHPSLLEYKRLLFSRKKRRIFSGNGNVRSEKVFSRWWWWCLKVKERSGSSFYDTNRAAGHSTLLWSIERIIMPSWIINHSIMIMTFHDLTISEGLSSNNMWHPEKLTSSAPGTWDW